VTKTSKKSKVRSAPKRQARPRAAPAYRLRDSRVHGSGLFATRTIPKDVQIIEYVGEHISHEEADRRHADNAPDDSHTFLFTIDAETVIDAGVGGNVSRFINHSCDPNCEVIVDDGRPFVVSIRSIQTGEELAYDYNLTRSPDDLPEIEQVFGCRCGAPTCRGTMLAPRKKPKTTPTPTKPKTKASKTKTSKTKTAKTKTARRQPASRSGSAKR
jgi:SET domain-containing protein